MKFIKKHLVAIIVAFVCLVLIILACFAVYRMFNPNDNKSIYGNRLSNAPVVDETMINEIKGDLLATKLVNTVNYETKVVIMKFYIDVKDNVKIADAEKLSETIMKKLDSSVVSFYDIEIYLTQKTGDFKEYPAIGYHSKSAEKFSWTVNKVIEKSDSDEA